MESLSLTPTTTSSNTSKFRFSIPCYKNPKNYRNLPFPHKRHKKFVAFTAKDEDKFNSWDQMELKFGKLIGEDPKLTLAKIIGRKLNPEMSNLEIEKLYYKKGEKAFNDVEEVPFDVSDIRRKPKDSLDRPSQTLTRPVPNKGVKFEKDPLNGLSLTRPVPKKGVKFEPSSKPVASKIKKPNQPLGPLAIATAPKLSVPNVTLRKPTSFKDDSGAAMLPRPNLSLKVSKEEEKEMFADMTLVRKPEPFLKKEETEATVNNKESELEIQKDISLLEKPEPFLKKEEAEATVDNKESELETQTDISLLEKPEPFLKKEETEATVDDKESELETRMDVLLLEQPESFLKREETEATVDNKESELEARMDVPLLEKPEPFLKREETEATVDDKESELETQTDISLQEKPELFLKKEETEATVDDKESELEARMDVSLLEKPEPFLRREEPEATVDDKEIEPEIRTDVSLLEKPEIIVNQDLTDVSKLQEVGHENRSIESQPSENSSTTQISLDAALIRPPKRLDQSIKDTSNVGRGVMSPINPIPYGEAIESENLPTFPLLKEGTHISYEREETDWKRAEELIKTSAKEDVELINSSTRGFVASFGSLIGFLPYRNLATKWKYLAFESWLRKKGLDPALYRQNLGVIGATSKTNIEPSVDPKKIEGEISPDMKLEELLAIYDQEKLKYLSSFVGQKIRVNVVLADRESKKLIFSVKPREKDEAVERKRCLMAKLSVGDVIKCCIKKITYYGIFVEVERVPALIHQTEVSWDETLDPTSYFKIGQVVEAKVHQLDFSLGRIFLSLKEITPDPLVEALEAVVGDQTNLDGRLEAAQPDTEWAEVESLVKELQRYEGIELVKKGQFFLSPGLAPTFQVYMASVFENEYKLLARAGNKVQEVMVQTSMGKEEMKSAILTCANRVE